MQRLINVYLVALVATTTFFFAQAGPPGAPGPAGPPGPTGPAGTTPTVPTDTTGPPEQNDIIFSADLTNGSYFIASGWEISWLKNLGSESGKCNLRGVVKITFPPPQYGVQRCKLVFDLFILESDLNKEKGWVFDISDSTNNGYGGDAGTTSNSAEVHSLRQQFLVYSNTLPGYTNYGVEQNILVENTQNAMSPFVTVTIGDEFVEFDNHYGLKKSYQSPYLFTLNGQKPTYGTANRDIFFSMNRVVYPYSYTSRRGVGLCKAIIKAVNCDS